jgi:starch-binding outer membrane protein, SusD/RagB family
LRPEYNSVFKNNAMKKIFSNYCKSLCGLLMIAGAEGCRKFVAIEPAPNLIETEAVFTTDNTALAAVSGVYTRLRATTTVFSNGALSLYAGLSGDELMPTSPNATTTPFFQNNLTPSNTTVKSSFYNPAYQAIYQTNTILEGLKESTSLADGLKKQLTGEMKVVRALCYYYLVNLYGDVPIVVNTDYRMNATLARTAREKVYEQMVSDLRDAKELSDANYATTGKVRPNKWTAAALLARVYLLMKQWSDAEEEASAVINSGAYNLLPTASIGNAFLKNSIETIWEIASPNEGTATGEGVLFVPSSATVRPAYVLTSELYNAFAITDQRRQWLGKNTVSGQEYWYPRKYKQRSVTTGSSPTEYEVVLRLAEQYLIRAEARAALGNVTGAQEDVNKIRNRAGLANSPANDANSLLTAVGMEKRIEFFAEWGHRWIDLKRREEANTVLSILKGTNWQPTDALYPIPDAELNYNTRLQQNPGY